MERAFMIVVLAVAVVGVLGAVLALLTGRRAWEQLDRDRLQMESDRRATGERAHATGPAPAPAPASASAMEAERDAELRQMLQARNARRRRRGEPELDAEAEIARLTRDTDPRGGRVASPRPDAVDPELAGEIRELVIARNHRRARRGKPPLDVESEVARELARLSG